MLFGEKCLIGQGNMELQLLSSNPYQQSDVFQPPALPFSNSVLVQKRKSNINNRTYTYYKVLFLGACLRTIEFKAFSLLSLTHSYPQCYFPGATLPFLAGISLQIHEDQAESHVSLCSASATSLWHYWLRSFGIPQHLSPCISPISTVFSPLLGPFLRAVSLLS